MRVVVSANGPLDTDAAELSRPYFADGLEQLGDDGSQMLQSVRRRRQQDHAKRQCWDVLLMLNVLVHRDEHIARRRSALHQSAVLESRPASCSDGIHGVSMNLRRKLERQILIKENAHRLARYRVRHPAPRQPAPESPTEIDEGTHRASHRPRYSRTAIGQARECLQTLESRPSFLDRCGLRREYS